ncbi:MAG: sensor histidine kinase [Acidimicrobiia bacterium]|jgi:hypothetical protein
MHIDELLGIAVANAEDDRVSLVTVEPAEIATEAVSGLAQLVAELVDNAVAFSEPGKPVEVTGRFDAGEYVISVVDRGVGMPPHLLGALNHVLEDPRVHIGGPEPKLGIQLVARLASRHGIRVRLVDTAPGTTARAVVPTRLVRDVGKGRRSVFAEVSTPTDEMAHAGAPRPVSTEGVGRTIDLTRYETVPSSPQPEIGENDVERFLESVFAPLRGQPGVKEPPATPVARERPAQPVTGERPAGPGDQASPPPTGVRTTLRVRVPGENFSVSEDEPSISAGEGAVDIRKALSSYDDGRRSAADSDLED